MDRQRNKTDSNIPTWLPGQGGDMIINLAYKCYFASNPQILVGEPSFKC